MWTDAILLPHAASAYVWAYNEIAKYSEGPFLKVDSALVYPANTADISAIIPADFYTPDKLEFRLNTSEDWHEVDRKDNLVIPETSPVERVVEWEFRLRTIFVNKATQGGLLRLTYLGLLAAPALTSDPVLMDNLVEALGYATAAIAYASRGQRTQAAIMWGIKSGAPDGPAGAIGLMDQMTDILVKNLQNVPRRGVAFSSRSEI